MREGVGRLWEADLKRRSKSSLFIPASARPSSSSPLPRISSIFMVRVWFGWGNQEVGGPELDFALAGAQADLGRLRRDGLVREHADPHARLTVGGPRGGDAAGLDLATGEPAVVERLEPEVAEGDAVPARCDPLQPS